jgi:beta-phosphoglucomutase
VPTRAVLFDFNGPILCEIFQELFAERGRPLPAADYFGNLVGLSDADIVRRWLGDDYPRVEAVVAERVARYRARVADGSSVPADVRAAVLYAADRIPVGVVSGAAREEVEQVLAAAGLASAVRFIVPADEVGEGKPHPRSYLRGLELLGHPDPTHVVAFEDTDVGVAAAKAAGVRCVGVATTVAPERLAAADEVVGAIDVPVIERLLGQ